MTLEPTETERRMTNAEAVLLTRYAKAACPQQQFDQYTPDAWADLLSDLRYVDAQAALKTVVQRQPFVSPAEIRDEVKAIRKKRLEAFGPMPDPPREVGADPERYRLWYRQMMREICDGDLTAENCPPMAELVARVMPDWENALPAPERVSGTQIATESRRVRMDPARLAEARAELEPLRAAHRIVAPKPPEPTAPDEQEAAGE